LHIEDVGSVAEATAFLAALPAPMRNRLRTLSLHF
jgi:hypothetical protein